MTEVGLKLDEVGLKWDEVGLKWDEVGLECDELMNKKFPLLIPITRRVKKGKSKARRRRASQSRNRFDQPRIVTVPRSQERLRHIQG